jgi:uncharacterized membrane protein YqgA involved in biofilm formation
VVIGPFINASEVLLGGVLGALLSQRLPERIRVSMTSIFGLASLGIGILLVVKCANLPVKYQSPAMPDQKLMSWRRGYVPVSVG